MNSPTGAVKKLDFGSRRAGFIMSQEATTRIAGTRGLAWLGG